MSMVTEFKEFAIKGNAVDMAIGIVIGVAFGKILSSFVNDVVMPPISLLIVRVDFNKLAFTLKEASDDVAAVAISYSKFIQTALDFVIIAFVIFMVIRSINLQKRKHEEVVSPPPGSSKKESLLFDIRNILQEKR